MFNKKFTAYLSLILTLVLVASFCVVGVAQSANMLVFEDDFNSGNFDKWLVSNGNISSDGVVRMPKASNASNFSPLIQGLSNCEFVFDIKFPIESVETAESGMKYLEGFIKVKLDNETQPYILGIWPWQITNSAGAVIGDNHVGGSEMKELDVMYTLKISIKGNVVELYRKRADQTNDMYTLICAINDYKGAKTSINFEGVQTGIIMDNFKIYSSDTITPITPVNYDKWEVAFSDNFEKGSMTDREYLASKWNIDCDYVNITDGKLTSNGNFVNRISPKTENLSDFVATFDFEYKNCPAPKYNEGWYQHIRFNVTDSSGTLNQYPILPNTKGVDYSKTVGMINLKVEKTGSVMRFYIKNARDLEYKLFMQDEFVSTGFIKPEIDLVETGFAMDNFKIYSKAPFSVNSSIKNGELISVDTQYINLTFSEIPINADKNNIIVTNSGNQMNYNIEKMTDTAYRIALPKLYPQKQYEFLIKNTISSSQNTLKEDKFITFTTLPNVVAQTDFTSSTADKFEISDLSIENGVGKMFWNTVIKTTDVYKNAIVDFDYRLDAEKLSEVRLRVGFATDNTGATNTWSYIDFGVSSGAHSVINGVDSVFSDYKFELNQNYNIRYVLQNEKFSLYAKKQNESEYTKVGEKTGVISKEGKISIASHSWGYIDNLKVYEIKPETFKYQIKNAKYDSTTNSFSATITTAQETNISATIIAATYKNSGVGKKVEDVYIGTINKNNLDFSNSFKGSGTEAKIFVFDGQENIIPMADTVTLN